MIKSLLLCTMFFVGCGSDQKELSVKADYNPVGEMADYVLDKNPQRTSGMIQEGSAILSGVSQVGLQYQLCIDYKMKISLYGWVVGKECMNFDVYLFSQNFMYDLRAAGYYYTSDYKIDYKSYYSTTTLDGYYYQDCDVLYIYDITIIPDSRFTNTKATVLKLEPMLMPTNVPVWGAVKLDVNGLFDGIQYKAGFDFKRKL